jgi:hypothetical protein
MAHSPTLKHPVRTSIALHAAGALATAALPPSVASDARVVLHESLPVWLITDDDLKSLRANRSSTLDFRRYIHKTRQWLHLLYRDDLPFGYVHVRQGPKDKHEVTNVSITSEAFHIRQALDGVNGAADYAAHDAGILECPRLGIAGIILIPKSRTRNRRAGRQHGETDAHVCLFRDPAVRGTQEIESPIPATQLLARLKKENPIRGPKKKRRYQL